MSKIGINGFGRIGRLVLRAAVEKGAQVRRRRQDGCHFLTHNIVIQEYLLNFYSVVLFVLLPVLWIRICILGDLLDLDLFLFHISVVGKF